MDNVDSDDELEIELRAPDEVAVRCIALACLIRRLSIETLFRGQVDETLAGEAFDLRTWLRAEDLWVHLSPSESAFLHHPLGALSDDDMAAVAWQAEGLAALGWALHLAPMPSLGTLTSVEHILKSVPSPWDTANTWIEGILLRPEAEIARERDLAEILEWRIGVEMPCRESSVQDRLAYDEAIAAVIDEAQTAAIIPTSDAMGIFAGQPLAMLDSQEIERLSALAEERLRAMNWLCGFGSSWDDVPLDV